MVGLIVCIRQNTGDADILNSCQNSTCLFSPAKLNLGLRIVGSRDDGLHLLESLFWPISLGDELLLRPSTANEVIVRWAHDAVRPDPCLPAEKENLVYRALNGVETTWRVELTKKIPMGAGLGGGSSNAGTLLRWLAREGQATAGVVERLAPALGADVPYFLDPKPAWVTGIGEQRAILQIDSSVSSGLFFLLVFPQEALITREVFSAYKDSQVPFSTPRHEGLFGKLSLTQLIRYLAEEARNDLEDAASHVLPRVKLLLERLRREPVLHAGLTGSGSTCYAVFNSAADREESAKVLQPFLRENFCRSLTAETYFAP